MQGTLFEEEKVNLFSKEMNVADAYVEFLEEILSQQRNLFENILSKSQKNVDVWYSPQGQIALSAICDELDLRDVPLEEESKPHLEDTFSFMKGKNLKDFIYVPWDKPYRSKFDRVNKKNEKEDFITPDYVLGLFVLFDSYILFQKEHMRRLRYEFTHKKIKKIFFEKNLDSLKKSKTTFVKGSQFFEGDENQHVSLIK